MLVTDGNPPRSLRKGRKKGGARFNGCHLFCLSGNNSVDALGSVDTSENDAKKRRLQAVCEQFGLWFI